MITNMACCYSKDAVAFEAGDIAFGIDLHSFDSSRSSFVEPADEIEPVVGIELVYEIEVSKTLEG